MRTVGIIAGLLVGLSLTADLATAQTQSVSFALDWLPSGRHAGWYVAEKKGFFEDEGVDVEISRGFGTSDTINRLRGGQIDLGFSDISGMILARAKESAPLKAVAVIHAKHPSAIFTHKEAGIDSPEELEGASIVDSAGSAQVVLFEAFAEVAGIDASKVDWVLVAPDAKMQMFLAGEVQGVGFFNMQLPLMQRELPDGVNMIEYGDHLGLYGNGILATDQYASENPDAVRGFVQASMRGWQYAFDHPDEAAALLQEEFPLLDPAVSKAEIEIVKEMMLAGGSEQLGFMDEERMTETRDLTLRLFNVDAELDVSDLYTNEFLQEQ